MKTMRITVILMFVLCTIMSVEAQEETPTLKSEGVIPQTTPTRLPNVITIPPQVKQLMPVALPNLPQKNSAAQSNEALSRRIDEIQGKLTEYKTIATTLATIAIEATNSNNKREAEQALLDSNKKMADSMDRSAAVAERAIEALKYTIAFTMVSILVLLGTIFYLLRKNQEAKELFEQQLRERAEAGTHRVVAVVPQQLKHGLKDIHATVSQRSPLSAVPRATQPRVFPPTRL